jgi:hypothetical protein
MWWVEAEPLNGGIGPPVALPCWCEAFIHLTRPPTTPSLVCITLPPC